MVFSNHYFDIYTYYASNIISVIRLNQPVYFSSNTYFKFISYYTITSFSCLRIFTCVHAIGMRYLNAKGRPVLCTDVTTWRAEQAKTAINTTTRGKMHQEQNKVFGYKLYTTSSCCYLHLKTYIHSSVNVWACILVLCFLLWSSSY